MKPAYTLFLKTGPACNAGCITCPSGTKLQGDTEKIPLMTEEVFVKIVDTVLTQGSIVSVILHYYNEPTLNPHIAGIVRQAKRRGLRTVMSTNGSFPEKLKIAYAEGIDNLIFSLSGFSQAVHERSHKGVNIETVKSAMIETAKTRDLLFPSNYIKGAWHDYQYNQCEREQMKEFCESINIHFDPYHTSVLPLHKVTSRFYEIASKPNIALPELIQERDLFTKLPEAKSMCADRRHWKCIYQEGMFAVDGNGDISLCPADLPNAVNSNIMANLFDGVQLNQLNQIRKESPWCLRCKSVGAHVYGMQKYKTPITFKNELSRKTEDVWRALSLGSRFPWLARKLGEWMYERPGKN